MLTRRLEAVLSADLAAHDKMLFVAGPRQCGKTTLAKALLKGRPGTYWNHDIPGDRALLAKKPLYYEEIDRRRSERPLVVLDELHKLPRWKNYLKGAFDRSHDGFRFLVTGNGKPLFLVEAKHSDPELPASLTPFTKKLGVPAILLVNRKGISRTAIAHEPPVTVVSAESWLAALP